ncbi:hypothetical protein AN4396.2 [Aspergillus nidulans FGSC A4]|nr:hypothetical protein AN4396.2 [Aspergillus nidulans FGSC A4]|eukprot:XP_662000.1 hypothetical protein AN4396.2 [Aspergillus nidulans FGSC A4]
MSNEFLCILPDKPDAQAKRLEVRSKHLEGVKPLVEAGKVVVGGAMLNAHPSEGETPSFKGSMLIVLGEKEEDAWEVIRNDIYTKSGVWDLNAAQVIPYLLLGGCYGLRLTGLGFPTYSSSLRLGLERKWMLVI